MIFEVASMSGWSCALKFFNVRECLPPGIRILLLLLLTMLDCAAMEPNILYAGMLAWLTELQGPKVIWEASIRRFAHLNTGFMNEETGRGVPELVARLDPKILPQGHGLAAVSVGVIAVFHITSAVGFSGYFSVALPLPLLLSFALSLFLAMLIYWDGCDSL